MAVNYLDKWQLNGTEVLIADYGKGRANGVIPLNEDGKIGTSYLTADLVNNLKVSPDDPYDDLFPVWVQKVASQEFRNRGKTFSSILNSSSRYVVYFKGVYVAGLANGFWWSENTINWTQGKSATSGIMSGYAIKPDTIMVAGLFNGGIWWSEDGKSWTKSTLSSGTTNLNADTILYANGLFVAPTRNAGIWWSEDGKVWTQGLSGVAAAQNVIYENETFICNLKSGLIYWSEDGKTWTLCTGTTSSIGALTELHYFNHLFLACGGVYSNTSERQTSKNIYWSLDGRSWTQATGLTNIVAYTMVQHNGILVCGSTSGVWWSEDGKVWTQVSNIASTYNIGCVIYANGLWVCGGKNSGDSSCNVWWSIDGKTWTQGTVNDAVFDHMPGVSSNLQYHNGVFSNGKAWSKDGKIWYGTTLSSTILEIDSLYYVNDIWFVGPRDSSGTFISKGQAWTPYY